MIPAEEGDRERIKKMTEMELVFERAIDLAIPARKFKSETLVEESPFKFNSRDPLIIDDEHIQIRSFHRGARGSYKARRMQNKKRKEMNKLKPKSNDLLRKLRQRP